MVARYYYYLKSLLCTFGIPKTMSKKYTTWCQSANIRLSDWCKTTNILHCIEVIIIIDGILRNKPVARLNELFCLWCKMSYKNQAIRLCRNYCWQYDKTTTQQPCNELSSDFAKLMYCTRTSTCCTKYLKYYCTPPIRFLERGGGTIKANLHSELTVLVKCS